MSHKLAKLIKRQYQASKSASSKCLGRRLGDRPLLPSSIANVATGTFAGLILAALTPVFLSSIAQAKPYSMTVTIDNSVIDMNISPSKNGSFSKSSNSTVSVSTTNASGYTLSIASSDRNDGRLVNSSDEGNSNSDNSSSSSSNGSSNDGTNGNNYLSSISSATTEEQFRALDATSYNNMWGYLPSKWDGKDNTAFLPSPTTSGDVLDHTTTANTLLDDSKINACERYQCNEYTIAIGARVDTTQRIGSYSNTYVVLATANGTPYTITYKDDTISNFPTDVSSTADSATVPIAAAPVKPGYTFLGWCTVAPTPNSNGNDSCTGTTYAANSTWGLDQTSGTNNLVLYAMWGDNYTIDALLTNGNTPYMQDFNTMSADKKGKVVASMEVGKAYTVKDTRHASNEAEPEYKIAKLKDGNVWMLDNLRLGSNDEAIELTPADTNIVEGYTLPQGVTSEFGSYDDARINANYKNNTDVLSYGQGSGRVGVYYNYCAASAGKHCGAGVDVAGTIVDLPFDVCPKGWRMPTGGTDGNGQMLFNEYNTTQVATNVNSLQYNLSVSLAGVFGGSAQVGTNSSSPIWTSTYNAPGVMYDMTFTSDRVMPVGMHYRDNGVPVRCLLDN